jgi:LacI family transcriptional regulator
MKRASVRHKVKVEWVPARHATFDAGKEVAAAVCGGNATAAITFDDSLAHGLLAGLAELGVTIPRDFSVIGCDDVLGASTHPALTSISSRCVEAGRMAVDLLISTLKTGKRSDIRCVLDTNLVIRATTTSCPSKVRLVSSKNNADRLYTQTF